MLTLSSGQLTAQKPPLVAVSIHTAWKCLSLAFRAVCGLDAPTPLLRSHLESRGCCRLCSADSHIRPSWARTLGLRGPGLQCLFFGLREFCPFFEAQIKFYLLGESHSDSSSKYRLSQPSRVLRHLNSITYTIQAFTYMVPCQPGSGSKTMVQSEFN